MSFGEILRNRMAALGIDVKTLAIKTFLEEDYIWDIIKEKIDLSDVSEIDLEFISSALFCKPEYFKDNEVRKKDIIHASMNRGIVDPKTNVVKGKLQQFANDFIFIKEIMSEV